MPAPMHIAQILSGREMNGAVRHCFLLSGELARRNHDVLLIHRPQLDTRALAPGVRRAAAGFDHSPAGVREIAAIVERAGADVIHTHMSDAHAAGALLRLWRGLPCVATAHSRSLQLHWMLNDRIISPSATTADFHRRVNLVRRSRIRTVPNFVDTDAIRPPAPERRSAMRRRLGAPEDAVVIACLGGIVGYKRQSDLVEAFARMAHFGIPCRLLLVGGVIDAEEMARVHAAIRRHDIDSRVHLLGHVADPGAVLAAADIYAMSSRREEMPMAVLEAMASGLPVIGTRVGGMGQLVRDEVNGWLAPPGDIEALTLRLACLAADPLMRRRLGHASRAMAVSQFAPASLVDRIEAVLCEAAGLGRQRARHAAPQPVRREL